MYWFFLSDRNCRFLLDSEWLISPDANMGENKMSKYNTLWEYVQNNGNQSFKLTFEEIKNIAGVPIDHSFLKYKKELTEYGYQVGKISMKEQTVIFNKLD